MRRIDSQDEQLIKIVKEQRRGERANVKVGGVFKLIQ